MLPDHHANALTDILERLIPDAELALPMLRRPLSVELDKFIDSTCGLIRCDVQRALMICGRALDADSAKKLDPLVEEARARREHDLRALASRLSSTEPLSIASFVGPLAEDLRAAMELQAALSSKTERKFTGGGSPEVDEVARALDMDHRDLAALVAGDTAFRTLYYFLEVLKPVLEKVQPRSMLSIRSKRP